MKKFIAVFDGLKLSLPTLQYAIYLSQKNDAHLVGVFLEDFTYHSYSVYKAVTKEGANLKDLHELDEKDEMKRKDSVAVFEKSCNEAGLNYTVHQDKKIAIQELLHESIFADLLLISEGETMSRFEEDIPTNFIKELLPDVHCPVLLLPKQFAEINRVIFLYDGSPASVQAVKMFSYILEGLREVPVKVLCVKKEDDNLHLPDNKFLKELIRRHYKDVEYVILTGNTEETIITSLKMESPSFITVTGSYKRSTISMFFDRSFALDLMEEIKVPIFIG